MIYLQKVVINMILSFGETLRTLRLARSLSQSQLAKKIGVSVSMIGLYENSERMPSFETFLEISKVFNVSTDYLLGVDKKNIAILEVSGLTTGQIQAINSVIAQFKKSNEPKQH